MAKAIMIQGTMSNVGKSIMTAGLCRIFKEDGYNVAPFKSQNMALNSYITKDGLEMGRAQVVQAEACGKEPDVCMNPILLKPVTDMGSQVIVMGKVMGNMKAVEYYRNKKNYIPVIRAAYNKLADENDIIVIEGAGSPAEINLKDDDIVNMGMAEIAKSPVLLTGDIDRGGVFAQLKGTVDLLEDSERRKIKGLIINKFRGDKNILLPGLETLEKMTDKKILGVVPYMDIDIDDEDSLSVRIDKKNVTGVIDVAVIRLPKISNFTDFRILETSPYVSVRYVEKASELKEPDMVIIPGTKNTISDMIWLREMGIEGKILKLENSLIFGICGGYQILGENIEDVSGAEGYGRIRGMGLLPVDTYFEQHKTMTRTEGFVESTEGELSILSGRKVSGYEIHMGKSVVRGGNNFIKSNKGYEGCYMKNAIGTYIHGIFDEADFREGIIKLLCSRKNIEYNGEYTVDINKYKEEQYSKLAHILRENIDIKRVYEIIEEGV